MYTYWFLLTWTAHKCHERKPLYDGVVLITCHKNKTKCSKLIGTCGLYCGEQACFFRGLGWNGDGGGGRERTSPPRLICRGCDWRVNRRQGHGWCRHERTFYLPPFPRRPLTPSALFKFSHKIKEGDWLQETLGAKSLHEPFRVSHNLPCQKVPGGFEGWCIQRSMLTWISARDSRFLLLDCHICIKRSLCSNHILIITLKNINVAKPCCNILC